MVSLCKACLRIWGKRGGERASYLDLIAELPQIHLAPACLGPVRQERTPYTGIKKDVSLVIFIYRYFRIRRRRPLQHLCISTQIVTIVRPLDVSDICLVRQQCPSIRLAIHNEDKIGSAVQTVLDEELQIRTRHGRLRVGI